MVLDFESVASISAAFKGIETLFLVTPGSPDQARYEEKLLAEATKIGVKHVVKMSGKIAELDTVGFSVWNRAAEKRIQESGIPYTILRGNYFMQNLLGSAAQIKQGAFTAGPAAKRIALIDTRDIAATAVAALTEEGHAGQTYDLNGPELLDGYEQAAVFSKVLGRTVKYLDVTAEAFVEQLKSFGLPMVEAFGVALAAPEIPGDQSERDNRGHLASQARHARAVRKRLQSCVPRAETHARYRHIAAWTDAATNGADSETSNPQSVARSCG